MFRRFVDSVWDIVHQIHNPVTIKNETVESKVAFYFPSCITEIILDYCKNGEPVHIYKRLDNVELTCVCALPRGDIVYGTNEGEMVILRNNKMFKYWHK